jgi:integrase
MSTIKKRTWASGEAWVVRYKDQSGVRRLKTFPTKREAEAWRAQALYEVKQGTHTAASVSKTVAEACDLWLTRASTEGLETSTVRQYSQHVEIHIKPTIGALRLAELTTPTIEAFKDALLRGKSRALAGKILSSLKAVIKEAQRRGLVAQNVAAAVSIRTSSRDKHQIEVGRDVPTKLEAKAMIDAAEGRWRSFFITAIFTGLRSSELRGLTWDCVDLDAKVLHVRERVDAWNNRGKPKSAAGKRDVPLAPIVANALREWKLACPKGELGLVFPNGVGRHESHANIYNRGFVPLQIKAGVVDAKGAPKYSLHSLRHFAASWLIEQGFQPKRLQAILGHSSMQMTYDRYGHLFPNAEDDQSKLKAGEFAIVG